MPTGVVPYRVRARVVDINGVAPTVASFTFYLTKYGEYWIDDPPSHVSDKEVVVGTAFTNWMTVDFALATTLANSYQTKPNPWSYQHFFDFYITDLAMEATITEYTNIAGEIEVTETGEVRTFTAKLAPGTVPGASGYGQMGIIAYRQDPQTGGLMARRDSVTGQIYFGPAATVTTGQNGIGRACTLRQYHEEHYTPLANTAFPTIPTPHQYIQVSDHFSGGDLDHGNQLIGWQTLRRLGVTVGTTSHHDEQLITVLTEAGINRRNHEWYYPPNSQVDYQRYTNGDLYGKGDVPAQGANPGVYALNAAHFKSSTLGGDVSPIDHISLADEPTAGAGQGHHPPGTPGGTFIGGLFDFLEMALNTQGVDQEAYSPMTPELSAYAIGNFRTYIQSNGVTLADLGAGDWSSVFPIGWCCCLCSPRPTN